MEYPDAKDILEAQARERMQKNREVRRTSTADSTSSGGDKPAASTPTTSNEAPKPAPKPVEEKAVVPADPATIIKGKNKDTLWQLLKSSGDLQKMISPPQRNVLGKIRLRRTFGSFKLPFS